MLGSQRFTVPPMRDVSVSLLHASIRLFSALHNTRLPVRFALFSLRAPQSSLSGSLAIAPSILSPIISSSCSPLLGVVTQPFLTSNALVIQLSRYSALSLSNPLALRPRFLSRIARSPALPVFRLCSFSGLARFLARIPSGLGQYCLSNSLSRLVTASNTSACDLALDRSRPLHEP
jgi:hypothetical protein